MGAEFGDRKRNESHSPTAVRAWAFLTDAVGLLKDQPRQTAGLP